MEDPTTTSTVSESPVGEQASSADADSPNSGKMWRSRISRCKVNRKNYITAWSENVDYRRGKPFATQSDVDRVNVNLDWSLTKGKHAQLYSQTPQVFLTPKQKQFQPAVPVFAKQLNDTLTQARVGVAMDEATLDAINASGFGVALVGYLKTTETVQIPSAPAVPPMMGAAPVPSPGMPTDGLTPLAPPMAPEPVKMLEAERTIDERYYVTRLSPSNFLWPLEFTGSDFDDADWLGHSGTMLWSEAKNQFGLTDDQKEEVLGSRMVVDNLRQDKGTDTLCDDSVVDYDEVFYWAQRYDTNEKYFKRINRIVFVEGIKDPVIHEPWKGQVFDPATKKYAGACRFPLRVLTLTYISDDAIPPSDSAVGRPQIKEIGRTRTQILLQRDRSMPINWGDVNRLDPQVVDSMMRGVYQAIIPVQGDGSKVLGQVARAAFPPEEFQFDRVIKGDLQEQWQISSNQIGSFSSGERSASEANIIQQNFQTRIGYERARVAAFFTGIAEVLGGLVALFGSFPILGQEDIQRIDSAWDRKHLAGEYVYYIRPDATVLLDANQRIDRLNKYLNLVGKSGFVNVEPIIAELTELHGIDPADVMKQPQPPPPDQPNIGYSFKGEDLMNPIAIALLMRAGQAPTPEELQQAQNLLKEAFPPMPMIGPPVPPTAATPPGGPPPPIGPAPLADAHPNWGPANRITKRTNELGG